MRSCVKTSIPASGITSSVTGTFFQNNNNNNNKDIVTASGNTLTLTSWCSETNSLRLRYETTLPGRICALDKIVLSSNNSHSSNKESHSSSSASVFTPSDLLVALYSETHLAVMRWSQKDHSFKNVALFALSVEDVDGAVPVVDGISSERSAGLPPLLRVDRERNMILVLAQRRYIHSISLTVVLHHHHHHHHNNNIIAKTLHQDAAAPNNNINNTKTQQEQQKPKKKAVAWADEDESSSSSDEEPTDQNEAKSTTNNQESNPQSSLSTPAPFSFFEQEDYFYKNQLTFYPPKTFDLLSHIKTARNVRDVHFVHGFSEPTIAILREASATWAGRVRLMTAGSSIIRALSCGVVIANIDDVSEKITVVREIDGLPYSSSQLCPLPAGTMASLGGVLCFSANSVSHVTFRGSAYSAIINKLGRDESSADQSGNIRWGDMEFVANNNTISNATNPNSSASAQEKINAKRAQLAAARAGHLKTFSDITVVALSETSVFVSHAEDGSCDILDLSSTDNKTVSSIRCSSLPATSVVGAAATLNTIPVSSSANVSSMMIFLGSKIHDSFLLSYSCSSSNNSASPLSSSLIQQQQHKCSILGGFNKSLASAVDMDVVEYNPTDSALLVEMNRYSSEKAKARQLLLLAEKENGSNQEKTIDNPAASQDASLQKIKSDSAAVAIVMNPYGDLVSTDAPVLRPPPKPLAARIKASAILVAAGALPQHSHVTALRQHATIDVVHRQNMDCTAIFSLATQDPSAISQNNLEGKRLRDQYLQQQQSQQRNGSQTLSNAERNLLRNPETVVLLFGAAASTAVVGTFGGKLTQISAAESAFACNERTISAFELGFFDSTSESTCDIFLQLTSKSLNLISFKPNAGTTPKEKFARIDTILCPSTISNTIDDEAKSFENNNNNNLNSFRQAVVVSPDLSALVLTDQGSLHLIQVKQSNDTNGTIDVCFDEQEDLSREILPNDRDKIKFMATLSLANRRSSSTQTEDFENSFVVFATEQNHLYICSIETNKNNSTKSALTLIAFFSNFFVDFPTSALFQQHQNQNRNHGTSSSSTTSQIDGLLLCRMHGNSIGIPDDHLTLVIRRISGEISVYGLSNLAASTTTIKLWRKLSLLHDIDKTSASVVEKFETMAEKKRKKELLLEQQQQQLQQDSSFAINNSNTTNNSTSPSSLPLGCVRLCYIPNAAGAETDGIFVCGGTQSQIIVSDRGFARCHPIRCPNGSGDGVHSLVRCGASVNCKALSNGLVLCEVASVVLGRVQGQQTDSSSSLSLDLRTPWPSRRIPLPGTPHFVVYNSSNNCAVAVTSTLQPYRPTTAPYDTALKGSSSSSASASAVGALAALVVEHAVINETEGVPIPCQKRFKLQLLCSGAGWSLGGSYDLLENEVVLSCHNGLVNRSQSNAQSPSLLVEPGAAEYVIVGTAFPQGDDVACRGRLLIFGVALHSGTRQLHLVHAENTKAPISAVTTIGGLIIAAVGSSIRMCALDPSGKSSLITCAFLSYATYITSLTAMKDFLVVGDIFQSVSLVSVRAAHTEGGEHDTGEERIVLVAQDAFSREITATGFVSSQSEATILGCDSRDNLLALHYEPPRSAVLMAEEKKHRMMTRMNNGNEDGGNNNNNDDNNNMNHFGSNNNAAATSNVRGGIIPVTPLQLVQNYKLSGSITKMLRLRSPTPSTLSSFTGDNCSVYLTLDGEIGFVLPLSDKEFRILRWATTQNTAECENVGGLHVEAERTGRHSEVVMLQGAPMLDLHHIQDAFVSGSGNVLRKNVARRAGTTSDKMLSMLAKVHESFVEPMF